jgi:hypothetical protein
VDTTLSICASSGARCVGWNQPSLCWTEDLGPREQSGCAVLYVGAGAKPRRHKKVWRIGRRVAILAAVMPIPGSTVDHIETSMVTSEPKISA